MNIRLVKTIFLMALALPFITTHASLDRAVEFQIQQEINEALLKETLALTKKIDFNLELLAQQVGVLRLTGAQKQQILQAIKELRQFTNEIIRHPFQQVNPAQLVYMLHIILTISTHINDAIEQGFTHIAPFPAEQVIKRSAGFKNISLEQLQDLLVQNKIAIERLEKNAEVVGLKWWNKLFLRAEKLDEKYHISKKATVGALVVGAAIIALYVTPSWLLAKETAAQSAPAISLKPNSNHGLPWPLGLPTPAIAGPGPQVEQTVESSGLLGGMRDLLLTMKNKLGNRPVYDPLAGNLMNEKHLGMMGKFEAAFRAYGLSLAPAIGTYYIHNIKKIWENSAQTAGGMWENFKDFMRGRKSTNTQKSWNKDPQVSMSDLVGLEGPKAIIKHILDYIRDPERFNRIDGQPEKGYVLAGPPRTGKTKLAEAVGFALKEILAAQGRDASFAFLSLSAADVITYEKEDPDFIRRLFATARANGPTVIFIDEIDALRLQREQDFDRLCKLLIAMNDNVSHNDGGMVILIAATNRPENLDQALLQHGRFGKVIRFENPCFNDRKEFFARALDKRSVDISQFDLAQLAAQTENCNYDDLNAIVKTAVSQASKLGNAIQQSDMLDAINYDIRNILVETKQLSQSEKRLMAAHQAGYAVAASLLNPDAQVALTTIRPIACKIKEKHLIQHYSEAATDGIMYGDTFINTGRDSNKISTHDELTKQCMILLSGAMAEKVLIGSTGNTYQAQKKRLAFDVAQTIAFDGYDKESLPKEVKESLLQKAFTIVRDCEQKVITLLTDHKAALERVSGALMKKGIVQGDELHRLIAG